jgi:hypothetical protein
VEFVVSDVLGRNMRTIGWMLRATKEGYLCTTPDNCDGEEGGLYHINRRGTGPSGYLCRWYIYKYESRTSGHFSAVCGKSTQAVLRNSSYKYVMSMIDMRHTRSEFCRHNVSSV